ncbi:MAG: 2TM domain-containing protein [Haliscomenobacter sp.]|nr:2TM domain-containing protein [Haliscomenobacter sp.]MBK7475559.1 2TM domain-containing protein [Haliscomenobacter sp.]MBK8878857.1 2TM domain-containing protein [Haliscomenobacter sp.]
MGRRHYMYANMDPAQRKSLQKYRFIRHLLIYLGFNAFVIYQHWRGGLGFDWYPMTLGWGIGVAIHYLRAYGWPRGEVRRTGKRLLLSSPDHDQEEMALKPLDKRWSDKDLV